MKLSKSLKSGDLILVKDNGFEGSHLCFFLGMVGVGTCLVKWIDGRGDTCVIFNSDIDKRFLRVKIERVVSSEPEPLVVSTDPHEVGVADPYSDKLTIVVGSYRLVLKEQA